MRQWTTSALESLPELVLFLTVGLGYALGRLRLGKFSLGTIMAVLLVGLAVGVPLVLALIPRRWALRGLQAFLVLAALEWVRTMVAIIRQRQAQDEPYTAAAVILMCVAAFTVLSAILLDLGPTLRHYRPRK